MKLKNYVFEDEYKELLDKRKKVENDIKEQWKIIWEVTTQSSETRHDNAWFDEAKRVLHVLSLQYKEINNTINNAKVMIRDTLNQQKDTVIIWSKVKLKTGTQESTYEIWWLTWPGKISYEAPLAKAIIGKKAWDITQFTVGKNIITVTILDIS